MTEDNYKMIIGDLYIKIVELETKVALLTRELKQLKEVNNGLQEEKGEG